MISGYISYLLSSRERKMRKNLYYKASVTSENAGVKTDKSKTIADRVTQCGAFNFLRKNRGTVNGKTKNALLLSQKKDHTSRNDDNT
jgi:hypothetical protein